MNLVLSSGVLPNRFKTENPCNVWRVTPLIWGRVQEFLKTNGVGAVLRYNFWRHWRGWWAPRARASRRIEARPPSRRFVILLSKTPSPAFLTLDRKAFVKAWYKIWTLLYFSNRKPKAINVVTKCTSSPNSTTGQLEEIKQLTAIHDFFYETLTTQKFCSEEGGNTLNPSQGCASVISLRNREKASSIQRRMALWRGGGGRQLSSFYSHSKMVFSTRLYWFYRPVLLLQGTKKDHIIAKGPERAIFLCFQHTKQLQVDALTNSLE